MPRIKAASLGAHHELVWQDITAAVGELLDEADYESINLGKIADRAGVARNSLYRYAPDKAALMMEVARRVSAPIRQKVSAIAAAPTSASERVEGILDVLLRAFENSAVRLMLQPAVMATLPLETIQHPEGPFGEVARAMEQVIVDGIDLGEFRTTANEKIVAWLLGGVVRAAGESIMQSVDRSDDLIPVTQQLVLNALAIERPRT